MYINSPFHGRTSAQLFNVKTCRVAIKVHVLTSRHPQSALIGWFNLIVLLFPYFTNKGFNLPVQRLFRQTIKLDRLNLNERVTIKYWILIFIVELGETPPRFAINPALNSAYRLTLPPPSFIKILRVFKIND